MLIDIPKDVQFAPGPYQPPGEVRFAHSYAPRRMGDPAKVREAVELIAGARRPILYTGGGVINAGPQASERLRAFARATGAPVTSTLMGLGAYPADDAQWLGMVGMHGAYEANHALHDCDVMVCVGARFDDRVTGRLDAFSPGSKKVHIDIDPSSIGKIVRCDVGVVGDAGEVLGQMIEAWAGRAPADLSPWWAQIDGWRARKGFAYAPSDTVIKPQHAVERLYALTRAAERERGVYVTTRGRPAPDVGGPVLRLPRTEPLDDLGRARHHGLRPAAAVGVQAAHPGALVIDIAGEGQRADDDAGGLHRGSARAADQGLHPEQRVDGHGAPVAAATARRALQPQLFLVPAGLREAGAGLWRGRAAGGDARRAGREDHRDDRHAAPVIFDCRVAKTENCLPMIPSGKAHNDMILADMAMELGSLIEDDGKRLV